MTTPKVRDLTVPLSNCSVVSENATLHDAVATLEATKIMFDRWDEGPRVILVHNDDSDIIGTIRHYDVLWALEPKYKEFDEIKHLSRFGLSAAFVTSTFAKYMLWSEPLRELCRKATQIKVREIMSMTTEDQFIDADAPVTKAIHTMLLGNHPSLIVTGDKEIRGIIRIADIATHVFEEIKTFSTTIEE